MQTYNKPDGSIDRHHATASLCLLDGTPISCAYYTGAGSVRHSPIARRCRRSPCQRAPDGNGNPVGPPAPLVIEQVRLLANQVSGPLLRLVARSPASLQMRDQQIPDMISSQLDQLRPRASRTDQVNAIQNSGSGFPGASNLTGDRSVNAGDFSQWGGSNCSIAVLRTEQPIGAVAV